MNYSTSWPPTARKRRPLPAAGAAQVPAPALVDSSDGTNDVEVEFQFGTACAVDTAIIVNGSVLPPLTPLAVGVDEVLIIAIRGCTVPAT